MSSTTQAHSLRQITEPQYLADPYPLYHELRAAHPVYWDEPLGSWVVTGYAEVAAALRHPQLSAERVLIDPALFPDSAQELVGPPIRALTQQMIFRDAPDHTRLRRVWSSLFTPRQIEQLRQRLHDQAERLLDAISDDRRIELMGDLALPLHRAAIFEALGVPVEDRTRCAEWVSAYAALLDGKVRTRKGIARVLQAVAELMDYARQLLHNPRWALRDDLLPALRAEDGQGGCTEEELLANFVLVLVAGHQSSAHLIGTATLALLEHPDQLRLLRQRPALLPAVVTEALRYDSPVQAGARLARGPLQLAQAQIAAGQPVLLCLGAANRDPQRFAAPDRFDIQRPDNRPLSFGVGLHTCLGAPLARLQVEEALAALLGRYPQLELTQPALDWDVGLSSRGLTQLWIAGVARQRRSRTSLDTRNERNVYGNRDL